MTMFAERNQFEIMEDDCLCVCVYNYTRLIDGIPISVLVHGIIFFFNLFFRSNTFNEHCSKTPIFTEMYNVFEELYVFFIKSCKRSSVLQDRLKNVENALKLRNLSKTRWVYRSESIDAMWRSFEVVQEALPIVEKTEGDQSAKGKACVLQKKILKFDFIFAIMFMRVIMKKTKILTVAMQKPELNILDALSLIDATVLSLERIRNCKSEMNNQVDASVQFAKSTLCLDPEQEFAQKRKRQTSSRIDENPPTAVTIQFHSHYRKCIIEVLDSLITDYRDDRNGSA